MRSLLCLAGLPLTLSGELRKANTHTLLFHQSDRQRKHWSLLDREETSQNLLLLLSASRVALVPVGSSVCLRVMCLARKAETRRHNTTQHNWHATGAQTCTTASDHPSLPGGITVPTSATFKPTKTHRGGKKKPQTQERKGGRPAWLLLSGICVAF